MNFKALCLVGMFAVFGVNAAQNQDIVPDLIAVPTGAADVAHQNQQHVMVADIAPIIPPVPSDEQVNNNQSTANQMELPDLIEVPHQPFAFDEIATIIPPAPDNIPGGNNQAEIAIQAHIM